MNTQILAGLVLLGLLLSPILGFVHNIIGTPFLYSPTRYVVDPKAPERNAANYQRIYGYRGVKFLENINQENVEHNPKLYDIEDSTKVYRAGLLF